LGKFAENFEQYFLQLIAGRRRNLKDRLFLIFLFVASRFYRMAIQFRIWLYDKRIIRNRSIGCLVVSIGNVSCGGTGKTPVVEVFAKSLCKKGRKVAILSRGYRSKKIPFWQKMLQRLRSENMETPPKIVSDGKNLLLNSRYAGDEPYMLATNLKDVAVIVDKDRVKSGLYAIDRYSYSGRWLSVSRFKTPYQYCFGRFD
jgi:tetraacyldisaccharide 4'-kinase